jgi:hypothetical protein
VTAAEADWHDSERARLQWVAARMLLERGRPGFVEAAGTPQAWVPPDQVFVTFVWPTGERARIICGDDGDVAGLLLLVPRGDGIEDGHLYGLDGRERLSASGPAELDE